jgi:hypothetical protein
MVKMIEQKNYSETLTQDKNNNMCLANSLYLKLNPDMKKEKKKWVYNKSIIFGKNGSKNK